MSQVSIVDIEGNNPQIPTRFNANVGFAIPIANVLEILATTVAAGSNPARTIGSGNTIETQIQLSQAITVSDASAVGLAAFDDNYFSVDANGFVSLIGGVGVASFNVDAATAPGTDPVLPIAGVVTVTGAQVAAGTTANVIRTHSTAAGSYTIEIQRSSAQNVSTVGANGVSHFNDDFFTVDSNGFVSIAGGAIGQTITGNSGGALSPVAGNWNIFAAAVAAGTTPAATAGAGNTLTVNIQRSQAIASTNAANVGLAAFNSAFFSVDANGFVGVSGTGLGQTITGNSGGALSPTAGNWNILGAATAAGTTPVSTSGAASTLTVNVQRAQAIASTNAANVGLAAFDSAKFTVDGNGFVSVSGTGVGQTITGNTGGALSPTAGNWNIVTSNSTVVFAGSGSTLTQNFNLSNLILGGTPPGGATGGQNAGFGGNVSSVDPVIFGSLTSGSGNSIFGWDTGGRITSGSNNVFFGQQAGKNVTTGIQNNGIGATTLVGLTTGNSNTANGQNVLPFLQTGSSNTAIGVGSGTNYNGAESSNILIRNSGTNGESNTLRIGSHGSGSGQVNRAFMAGINGNTVSNTQFVTIDSSTNQMGTLSAVSSLITTYTANGTWTINPRTKTVRFLAWGGGGGGGSGRCGATGAAGGGGGGAAGGFYDMVFNAADLTGSPYTVTIGSGGTGGTSVNAVTTNGNPGNPGTNTTVGSFLLAAGSAGGAGGTTGSAAGGTPSYMTISGITTQVATGSAGNSIAAAAGSNLQNSYATGGGGGSGYANATARIGGAAGSIVNQALNVLVAGGAAGANTGATAGNGNSPTAQTLSIGGTGGGGGGHNGVTTAGTGGNGAFPGGGGGGGAGNLNSNPSGAGGNGANGYLVVIEYF